MNHLELRGLYPATVTPFNEDFSVDLDSLDSHLTKTASAPGVAGLAVNGGIGEIFSLTSAERTEVVRRAVAAIDSSQIVIAGIEARQVSDAVRDGVNAKEAGADCLLVLPPFDIRAYRRLSQHAPSVTAYFRTLEREVGLPMIVFQYPESTGCSYPLDVLVELAKLDAVVGVKVATPSVTRYASVWETLQDDVAVLAASDAPPLLGMLLHGSHGALIGIGAIEASVWSRLVGAALNGEAEKAREIFNSVCVPLMSSVYENQEPTELGSEAAAVKEALVHLGHIASARVRKPLLPISEGRKSRIAESLISTGLTTDATADSRV